MLTIYLLIALGIAIMYVEPWEGSTLNKFDIIIGIAVGLAWPVIAIGMAASWAFLAIAISRLESRRGRTNTE